MVTKKTSGLPSGGTPEEAEEFMGLLLLARDTEHECQWSAYFKKMGDRMMKKLKKE